MCVRASALHSKAYPGINSYISSFFQLAIRFDFVAYAVMGHSAGRLALVTKISSAFEDATRYRTLALQGLNAAITSFAKDNADAILCASLCLSNQEHDWLVHSEHLVASRMANKVSFQAVLESDYGRYFRSKIKVAPKDDPRLSVPLGDL
jgi:hypothetical protein